MEGEYAVCDVTNLKSGDVVYYFNYDKGEYLLDKGVLKDDNIYDEGVKVHGEDWKQYVSKYFINKVERNGEVLFEQEETGLKK